MSKFTQRFSKRALDFPDNPILGLEVVASESRKRGVRIIPLNIGAPDTSSPPEILESVTTYLANNNHVEYGSSAGDSELREARSRFYKDNLDLPIDPNEILITAGASEAMEFAVYSVTNLGDEILTPEPFFSNYLSTCYKYGTNLKTIPTRIEDGFHLVQEGESSKAAFDRITSYISPQTKAVIWSSPSNPTGTILINGLNKANLSVAYNNNATTGSLRQRIYHRLVIMGESTAVCSKPLVGTLAGTVQ